MTKFRDGSSLLLARRDEGYFATAVAPGLDPTVIGDVTESAALALAAGDVADHADRLGAHVDDGDPTLDDPITAERLADQDQIFGGWLPGFLDSEAERLARVEARGARQRVHVAPRLARPTLPASVIRRAVALEALAPSRVLLEDDVDSLGLVLAEGGIETVVVEPDPVRRAQLVSEAARAELGERFQIVDAAADAGEADVAVVSAGPPHLTRRALASGCEVVKPGGHLLVGLRAPFDVHFFRDLPATGLTVAEHFREIDLPALPGGYVIDGAGDQILLARPAEVTLAPPADDPAEQVREQPYYWLDFDELVGERFGDAPIEQLVDLVAAQHPVSEAMRTVSRSAGTEQVAWFDRDGTGFTAELTLEARHLLVTLVPYDLELEYAVIAAVLHRLGDHLTRVRPQLATLWRGESIVA